MTDEWENRLRRWRAELELFAQIEGEPWVPLARAAAECGVSRSTLRLWYRSGQIPSRLVDGPHGPQRLVPLPAVRERAVRSARIQRRSARELGVEAEVALLRALVDQLEGRVAALENQR